MATTKKSAAKSTAKSSAPAKKAPAKKTAAKSSGEKSARKPNAAFMKPMKPSAELAQVVGAQPQPRSEITKRVWDYIKKNNLQDPENKRQINADDKLRPVFGGKKSVSMFEMTKLVNGHLSDA
ncbi:MAG TPA: SWIB/MDM2 domain-containing protein [Gemmatimonadaceae bacterium]|jgi:chromatin remodeling complex protein RSC6|nr:SWIB/MDM2 domain-containing protein [Gemmatimonadaceae bacterium]